MASTATACFARKRAATSNAARDQPLPGQDQHKAKEGQEVQQQETQQGQELQRLPARVLKNPFLFSRASTTGKQQPGSAPKPALAMQGLSRSGATTNKNDKDTLASKAEPAFKERPAVLTALQDKMPSSKGAALPAKTVALSSGKHLLKENRPPGDQPAKPAKIAKLGLQPLPAKAASAQRPRSPADSCSTEGSGGEEEEEEEEQGSEGDSSSQGEGSEDEGSLSSEWVASEEDSEEGTTYKPATKPAQAAARAAGKKVKQEVEQVQVQKAAPKAGGEPGGKSKPRRVTFTANYLPDTGATSKDSPAEQAAPSGGVPLLLQKSVVDADRKGTAATVLVGMPDAFDVEGDVGAVGRFCKTDENGESCSVAMDLKGSLSFSPAGTLYDLRLVPLAATAMVVRVTATGGKASAAQVEGVYQSVAYAVPCQGQDDDDAFGQLCSDDDDSYQPGHHAAGGKADADDPYDPEAESNRRAAGAATKKRGVKKGAGHRSKALTGVGAGGGKRKAQPKGRKKAGRKAPSKGAKRGK